MDFPLQLEKSQISHVVLWALTWSTLPTFLNHLLTTASAPFTTFQPKKAFSLPFEIFRKHFFFSIIGSMHLLFFCFFCLECFPTDSTWLAHFVITISTQISSPGRHYITITLKKAQTLSHHPTFLLHNIHHNIKFMYLPVLLPTMDRELHKVWSTGCVVCAMLFTVCLQYLVHSRSLINNVE